MNALAVAQRYFDAWIHRDAGGIIAAFTEGGAGRWGDNERLEFRAVHCLCSLPGTVNIVDTAAYSTRDLAAYDGFRDILENHASELEKFEFSFVVILARNWYCLLFNELLPGRTDRQRPTRFSGWQPTPFSAL